jgi:hypothetical protein
MIVSVAAGVAYGVRLTHMFKRKNHQRDSSGKMPFTTTSERGAHMVSD